LLNRFGGSRWFILDLLDSAVLIKPETADVKLE
jgi:hypothetical protein